jgi:hypothetical protein
MESGLHLKYLFNIIRISFRLDYSAQLVKCGRLNWIYGNRKEKEQEDKHAFEEIRLRSEVDSKKSSHDTKAYQSKGLAE